MLKDWTAQLKENILNYNWIHEKKLHIESAVYYYGCN